MTTQLFPLHTEHPPVWGLASTTMAFLEIGAVPLVKTVDVFLETVAWANGEILVGYFGLLSYCTDIYV